MSLSKLLELDVEWTHKAQSISVGYLEIFIYPGVGWMFWGKFCMAGKVKGFSIVQIFWKLTWHLNMEAPNKKEIPIENHHL